MVEPNALSVAEVITLRDVLRQAGLSERKIQDVMLLLSFKPPQIQRAFYYVTVGWTQEKAGGEIGVSNVQVHKYIHVNCRDIKAYLELSLTD